jgi:hypothetical protein
MKAEVCEHCDNCDGNMICSRYNKPIIKIGCCGIFASKSFHKPFTRRGVNKVIEYRADHTSPLRLGKEGRG